MLTDAISVGLTANFVTETLAEVSASGVSFDFGVIYNNLADINGLSIGVVAKNFGSEMTFSGTGLYQVVSEPPYGVNRYLTVQAAPFEMPFNFQLAAGYQRPLDAINTLEFTGIYMNNNFSPDEFKFGAEYGYNKMFFVRAGYQFASDPGDSFGDSNYLYGFTAGAGFNYQVEGFSVKVDYAYRYAQFFDGNNVFALTLGF